MCNKWEASFLGGRGVEKGYTERAGRQSDPRDGGAEHWRPFPRVLLQGRPDILRGSWLYLVATGATYIRPVRETMRGVISRDRSSYLVP